MSFNDFTARIQHGKIQQHPWTQPIVFNSWLQFFLEFFPSPWLIQWGRQWLRVDVARWHHQRFLESSAKKQNWERSNDFLQWNEPMIPYYLSRTTLRRSDIILTESVPLPLFSLRRCYYFMNNTKKYYTKDSFYFKHM